MFGSQVLEVAIGLIFVFVVFSLIQSTLNEFIASWFQLRAKNLRAAITQMLGEKTDAFFKHALIDTVSMPAFSPLGKSIRNRFFQWNPSDPSYIESSAFAKAAVSILLDERDCNGIRKTRPTVPMLRRLELATDSSLAIESIKNALDQEPNTPDVLKSLNELVQKQQPQDLDTVKRWVQQADSDLERAELQQAVVALGDSHFARTVTQSINEAGANLQSLQSDLEEWFDRSMRQASGWYTKKIRAVSIALSFFVAAFFNVDAIRIAEELYVDPTLRETIVAQAQSAKNQPVADVANRFGTNKELRSLSLPIGWSYLFDGNKATNGIDRKTGKEKTSTPSSGRTSSIQKTVDESGETNSVLLLLAAIPRHLPGILLSTFAISLGATFWFDILNHLFRFRTQVKEEIRVRKKPKGNTPVPGAE